MFLINKDVELYCTAITSLNGRFYNQLIKDRPSTHTNQWKIELHKIELTFIHKTDKRFMLIIIELAKNIIKVKSWCLEVSQSNRLPGLYMRRSSTSLDNSINQGKIAIIDSRVIYMLD